MAQKIKNLEFHVGNKVYDLFEEATEAAVVKAMEGRKVAIDIIAYSHAAAKAFGIEEEYEMDPEASVTCRIVVTADNQGRVP